MNIHRAALFMQSGANLKLILKQIKTKASKNNGNLGIDLEQDC